MSIFGVTLVSSMTSSKYCLRRLYCLVSGILVTNTTLHRRAIRNTLDPLQHMWEWLHFLLREARSFPALDPWPSTDIGNRVFAFARPSKVLARLAGIFTREANLKNPVHSQGFIFETFNGVCRKRLAGKSAVCRKSRLLTWDLLLRSSCEVIHLALVRGSAAMPKEQPLKGFISLQFIGKPEDVLSVGELQEI